MTKEESRPLPWTSEQYRYNVEKPQVRWEIDPDELQEVADMMYKKGNYGESVFFQHSVEKRKGLFVQIDWNTESVQQKRKNDDIGEKLRVLLNNPLKSMIELRNLTPGCGYAQLNAYCRFPGGYEFPEDNPTWYSPMWSEGFMAASGEQPTFALPLRHEYLDGNLLDRLNNDDSHAPVEFYTPREGEVYVVKNRHLARDPDPEDVMQQARLSVRVQPRYVS